MVWSAGSFSANETAAFNADNPLFVGHNVLRDYVDARWTTTGTQSGTDVTQPLQYTYRAWDGRSTIATNGFGTLGSDLYFNVQIAPSTVDTLALTFATAFPSAAVYAQVADNGNHSSHTATWEYFGVVTGNPRLAVSFNGGARYVGLEYIRIYFAKASGVWTTSNMPRLTEMFLGYGRVLGIGWGFGSDLSPNAGQSKAFEARSGEQTRYIHHYSRHVARHEQNLSQYSAVGGLDDVTTIRTLASESHSFKRPLLYIPRPSSALNRALLGFANEDGLDMPQNDFDSYEFKLSFDEQPFYRLQETA